MTSEWGNIPTWKRYVIDRERFVEINGRLIPLDTPQGAAFRDRCIKIADRALEGTKTSPRCCNAQGAKTHDQSQENSNDTKA